MSSPRCQYLYWAEQMFRFKVMEPAWTCAPFFRRSLINVQHLSMCVPHLTLRRLPPGSLWGFIFTKDGLVHCHFPFCLTRFFGGLPSHGPHSAIWACRLSPSLCGRSLCDWLATSFQAGSNRVWWWVQGLGHEGRSMKGSSGSGQEGFKACSCKTTPTGVPGGSKWSNNSGGVIGTIKSTSEGVLGGGPGGVRGDIGGGTRWSARCPVGHHRKAPRRPEHRRPEGPQYQRQVSDSWTTCIWSKWSTGQNCKQEAPSNHLHTSAGAGFHNIRKGVSDQGSYCVRSSPCRATRLSRLQTEAALTPFQTSDVGRLDPL